MVLMRYGIHVENATYAIQIHLGHQVPVLAHTGLGIPSCEVGLHGLLSPGDEARVGLADEQRVEVVPVGADEAEGPI